MDGYESCNEAAATPDLIEDDPDMPCLIEPDADNVVHGQASDNAAAYDQMQPEPRARLAVFNILGLATQVMGSRSDREATVHIMSHQW